MSQTAEGKDEVVSDGPLDKMQSLPFRDNTHHLEMQNVPPSLEYELTKQRRKSIFWNLTVIGGINTIAPTLIFYLYKHLAGNYQRNPALTYTWVTLALGTLELFQWPYRTYFLYRDNFARSGRPLGTAKRSGWNRIRPFFTHQDMFGTHFFLCIVVGAICLTLCCSLGGTRGSFPLLVISIPTVVLYLGLVLAISSVCTALEWKTPFQISSLAAHQPFRPGFFFIMEDIVAVDGGGGFEYRKRISKRYESSPPFRTLMQHLNILFTFWAVVLFLVSLGLVIANVQRGLEEDIVYGVVVAFSVGWTFVVTVSAWYYAKWSLRKETTWWNRQSIQEQNGLEQFETISRKQ